MSKTMNTGAVGEYVADILVQKGGQDVCVMTGCSASTVEGCLEKGLESAGYYTTDAGGPCYEAATVIVHALCAACKGHGRKLKARSRWTYVDCKACEGRGQWPEGTAFTVVRRARRVRAPAGIGAQS